VNSVAAAMAHAFQPDEWSFQCKYISVVSHCNCEIGLQR
jgi:hypothetical protein